MRTTHSFGIDFLIRRCKDKNKALIYVRITVDEERREISLKEQIDVTDWDPRREIVTKSIGSSVIFAISSEEYFASATSDCAILRLLSRPSFLPFSIPTSIPFSIATFSLFLVTCSMIPLVFFYR